MKLVQADLPASNYLCEAEKNLRLQVIFNDQHGHRVAHNPSALEVYEKK